MLTHDRRCDRHRKYAFATNPVIRM